jgi:transcription elongation GreA/GreB family factor
MLGVSSADYRTMSRAFLKEVDDAPLPPLPERPVRVAPNLVTRRGARLIKEAVAKLEEQIAAVSDESVPTGLRRDLLYWLARRSNMQIMPSNSAPSTVEFGVRATIRRDGRIDEIVVVGEDEAEPSAGLIAWTAPLARALRGAQAGETVDLEVGGRVEPVTVIAIAAGGLVV